MKTNEQIAREAAAQAASDCRMALATEQPGDKAPGHAHFEAIIYKQVLDCLTQAQESREGEKRAAIRLMVDEYFGNDPLDKQSEAERESDKAELGKIISKHWFSAHPSTGKEDGEHPDTRRLDWLLHHCSFADKLDGSSRVYWGLSNAGRNIIDKARAAQSSLRSVKQAANRPPTPPPGYSAEELERDNPFNAWMQE